MRSVGVALFACIVGFSWPLIATAASGVVLSPALTRIGEQVSADVFHQRGTERFAVGPTLFISQSLLPEPTVFGIQLGWQHLFADGGRFRPYIYPEYQLIFFQPGLTHNFRMHNGVELALAEHWWVGQSFGFGFAREQFEDYREWAIDGMIRFSTGYRF